LTTKTTMMMEV